MSMSYLNHMLMPSLRRSIVLPFYWKYLKNSKVLDYYQELQEHQWNSFEQNLNLQRTKLFQLIQYASQNIPYYRKVVQERYITFHEDTIDVDIKKFPILTKEVIRKHFHELYQFRDHTYYQNSSGGSTGEPVILYQDRFYHDWSFAAKILFDSWAGRKIGEPMVKLWSSTQDILREGFGLKEYFRQQLYGLTMLNCLEMKEEDMNEYVKKINAIKPKLILAYTNSMNLFARFIQEHQLTIHPVRAIMTSSGVLFPEIRSRIEEVFHTTSIFDRYGSREVGDIACNCKNSQGLHLVPDIHYLEIVDDEGKSLPPGQSGNILITLLTNYTMPLIRYKIGDLGIMSLGKNQCGHDLPTLEKVIGRINASFKNKFGDFIITGIFYPLFYFKEDIKQFQMIQEEVDLILINLVLTEKGKLTDMRNYFREIEAKIEKIMGHKTTVQFHILDEIKPSPSGKYLYAFSKIYQSINT